MLTVEFTVLGRPFIGLNGGPQFKFDEAVCFVVSTEDQAETDRYWNAIIDNGGSGQRMRLVQGQIWLVVADHAAPPDRALPRGRRARQARVRGDDDDDARSTSPSSTRAVEGVPADA